jgi:hypothetical protein
LSWRVGTSPLRLCSAIDASSPRASALANLSIRARFALAARSFELALERHAATNDRLEALRELFWEFTSTRRLDVWERRIHALAPRTAADLGEMPPRPCAFVTLCRVDRGDQLRVPEIREGVGLAEFLMGVVAEIIEVGRANLYAAIVARSPETLAPTLHVLFLLEENGIVTPDIAPFMESPFSEGWGTPRPRAWWVRVDEGSKTTG